MWRVIALAWLLSFGPVGAAVRAEEAAQPQPQPQADPVQTVCDALGAAAAANGLPVEFFTRLIWQESRFNARAISPAGAQGIAQFMPSTAGWRGLADPFEPVEALHESAEYLRDLYAQFGNLGLAAAAYNAGPGRVAEWLAGRGGLPRETVNYVRIVTGHAAEDWAAAEPPQVRELAIPRAVPCTIIAGLFVAPRPRPRVERSTAWGPWGVQLVGHRSEQQALADYDKLRRRFPALRDRAPMVVRARIAGRGRAAWSQVRVAADTRQNAEKLCAQLRAAGGACVVLPTKGGVR